eukprot:1140404-Pelagomonas_calceolata.AAC.2
MSIRAAGPLRRFAFRWGFTAKALNLTNMVRKDKGHTAAPAYRGSLAEAKEGLNTRLSHKSHHHPPGW